MSQLHHFIFMFIRLTTFCIFTINVKCETLLTGDVTVAGLFQIQNEADGQCTSISPTSVKLLEAVKWTFQKLNNNEYIPGVTIGFDAWPTCQMVAEATDRTVDLIYRIRQDNNYTTSSPLVALIGPNYSNEMEKSSYILSSMRTNDQLLQLGFSTTAASLSDHSVYSNFYRIVPSDVIQTEVMISLMVELNWNYVAVIYDNDIYGTEGKDGLLKATKTKSICIAATYAISTGAINLNELKGALTSFIQNTESPIGGVVVFTSESHVEFIMSAATALQREITDQLSFIISEAVGLSDSYFKDVNNQVYTASRGVYVVSPPRLDMTEFEMHWKDIFSNVSRLVEKSYTNDWLRDVYHSFSNCLPSTDSLSPRCSELTATQINSAGQKSVWTSYAIKSAYVIAKTLKNVHNKLCPGQSGVCTDLKNAVYKNKGTIIQEMQGLSINFNSEFSDVPSVLQNITMTFSGRPDATYDVGFTDYEVYHYRHCLQDMSSFCFEKIGSYIDKSLDINKSLIRDYHNNINGNQWPDVNQPQCKIGRRCSSCIQQQLSEKIYFKDGDVLVGVIVPIYHNDINDPLKCGSIRTSSGTELLQAMEYAVDLINNKTYSYEHVFSGKTVGFVVVNSCHQPLLVENKLISLHKNGLKLDNGSVVGVGDKIIGYVGPYGSIISEVSSDILSKLGFVQVSYASTAVAFSDKTKYPYFIRVSTPDDKQADAMIDIIKHAHYNSDYVQIVYSEGTYGEAGLESIRQASKSNEICIANTIKFKDNDNVHAVLEKLRIFSFAKIVIIFVTSQHISSLTSALNEMYYGEFMFIGSEAWGYRPDELTDKHKLVGSLIVSLQMPQNKNFTDYLHNFDVSSKQTNPWFGEYIANKFNCHLSTSFDKTFVKQCGENLRLVSSDRYEQEIWTPFALNAMLALLSGTSEAFNELCGVNSPIVCDQFKRNPIAVRNKVINQKLDIDGSGQPIPLFDGNGDGNVGYKIYNLQRKKDDTNVVVYKQVGQFPLYSKTLQLDVENIVLPDDIQLPSVCLSDRACAACNFTEDSITPTTEKSSKSSESNTAAVSGLSVFVAILVIAVIVLAVIVVLLRRQTKSTEKENYDYLDVVNVREPRLYETSSNDSTTEKSVLNVTHSGGNKPAAPPRIMPSNSHGNKMSDPSNNLATKQPEPRDNWSCLNLRHLDPAQQQNAHSQIHSYTSIVPFEDYINTANTNTTQDSESALSSTTCHSNNNPQDPQIRPKLITGMSDIPETTDNKSSSLSEEDNSSSPKI